ncbi:MAG: methionine adenosyltransferase [Pseudomonadota bacterium]
MIAVETLSNLPVARRRFELVERKGLGHPDTLCDALAEAISLALNRMYQEHAGTILHYNVDKALLVAGQCEKGFGWGRITRAMEFIVGDRATFKVRGKRLPIEGTVKEAVDGWLAAKLPQIRSDRELDLRIVLAPGSEPLRGIFRSNQNILPANDTVTASGYAPLSPTENLVLAIEHFLNDSEFKSQFPDTGQDVKLLALRDGESVSITLAMPLLCTALASESHYFQRKEEILEALQKRFQSAPFELHWAFNCLDQHGSGSEGTYLTITGTSAEDADSGQVGRGNGVNGLIAPGRPRSGEAAAGKNPVSHVGKIYSVLAHRLAGLILDRCPELSEAYVHLAIRIGDPVDRPWVDVQILPASGLVFSDVERVIHELVETELARIPVFCAELASGLYPLY